MPKKSIDNISVLKVNTKQLSIGMRSSDNLRRLFMIENSIASRIYLKIESFNDKYELNKNLF